MLGATYPAEAYPAEGLAGGTQAPATPTGRLLVSFTDINPPVRHDGIAWTTVQISEAPSLAGPWTVIDTQTLSPADGNPEQPQARNFTTRQATIPTGFYTLTFIDATGASSHPIEQVQDVPSEIQPSLSDLGSLLRARTVVAGTGGSELGTFTSNTRPTDTQATALIEQATNYVLMDIGAEIPDRMIEQAKLLVLLYAAQLVEITYFRNEVTRDQSAFQQYQTMYDRGIQALKLSVADADPASPQAAMWSMPVLNQQQRHWQNMFGAMDPKTGAFDPSKLPPDEFFPYGAGGIPAGILGLWPWLFGGGLTADNGLAFLED